MKNGDVFPAIEVIDVPGRGSYIIEGHHRYVASILSDKPITIIRSVQPGPIGLLNWLGVSYE